MRPTLKSINENLPRFDTIRRNYMRSDAAGFTDGRNFLGAAFADIDEAGNVKYITLYAVGDAMEERHYHADRYDDVVEITEQIEDALSADRLYNYGGSKGFRAQIVREIQEAIEAQTANH